MEFDCLSAIRRARPLIHCVSNIVSANDCANVALAVGASPLMAQAMQEMEAVTAASAATVLNTGTPEAAKFQLCRLCGRLSRDRNRPVVLDPVGVGASPWRLAETLALLEAVTPAILHVNLGEAQALLQGTSQAQGVDAPASATRRERADTAAALARRWHTVVLLSGPEDIVTDGNGGWCAVGGSGEMTRVTGTGCMLSMLCGVFAAVEPDAQLAAAQAAAFWNVCASRAETAAAGRGPGTFRTALLDAAGTLTDRALTAEAHLGRL